MRREEEPLMKNTTVTGLLYDATKCIGCLECERACAKQNGNPYDESIAQEKKTSAHKFTYVATLPDDKYMRRLCMHCGDPTCASVCPVGALQKTALGPVIYDASRCMGCRYCMVACPFNIPKYEWSKAIPAVRKCTGCYDRRLRGEPTACAEACPTEATISGARFDLLAEARRRLSENPTSYVNHIYGEREVGGTSNLFLSSIDFGSTGLPVQYGTESLPPLTGEVLAHVPDVATVGMAVLGGIYWITHRRELVAAAEKSEKQEEKGGTP
jgi:formate dehydrogenase iron-sulfur subunit